MQHSIKELEALYWRRHVVLHLNEKGCQLNRIAAAIGLSNSRIAQLRDRALNENRLDRRSPMQKEFEGGEVREMAHVLMRDALGRRILSDNAWNSRRGFCSEWSA